MPAKGGRYHHGDLRSALVDAAIGVIADRGVRGFSLAEASRRLGVTTAAPSRPFADRDELLATVAVRALNVFAAMLAGAADAADDPRRAAGGDGRLRTSGSRRSSSAVRRALQLGPGQEPPPLSCSASGTRWTRCSPPSVLEVCDGDSAEAEALLSDAIEASAHGYAMLLTDGEYGQGPDAVSATADRAIASARAAHRFYCRAACGLRLERTGGHVLLQKDPRPGSGGCRGESVRVSHCRAAVPHHCRPPRRRWSPRSCCCRRCRRRAACPTSIPAGSPAACRRTPLAARLFGYPLEAGVAVVQRDASGLPSPAVNKAARAAEAYDRHPSIPGLLAGLVLDTERGGHPGRDHRLAWPARPPCSSPASAGTRRRSSRSSSSALRRDDAAAGSGRADVREPLPDRCRRRDRPGRRPVRAGADHQPRPAWVELFTVPRDRGHRPGSGSGRCSPRWRRCCAREPPTRIAIRVVMWGAQRTGIALPQEADLGPGGAAARRHHRLLRVLPLRNAQPAGRGRRPPAGRARLDRRSRRRSCSRPG